MVMLKSVETAGEAEQDFRTKFEVRNESLKIIIFLQSGSYFPIDNDKIVLSKVIAKANCQMTYCIVLLAIAVFLCNE